LTKKRMTARLSVASRFPSSPINCLPNSVFSDRNYTAMCTHVQWSVHLSALLITWFTWGDRLQRRYASDIAFCIIRFPLTVDNSDMN
jgi:hypothetical protein